ncbi:MAG: bifunctional phosphopantothenoylcysteine decarboxylase/phosphopantothenate--cysteine ligase CoaBC [Emcibacteraceae bacterium]|nr:bifunctional phosphopantothenoylcysteine decarboxylase/phosphopantothenate--cysteine ligase CoaBC [Emcibacteraceae bacterium]MDG1997193.1 bifunctional phosphopantothenoylcysteine decarboxylase/phosphopantothenate--cysteine ligase CoaBC [Emcibacteraceae bacterium]
MDILENKKILLIIGGGIAAYKCLDLIRRLRERGVAIKAILTKGGEQFVTPLAVSSLTEHKVYQDLFSLTDEAEMGHIRLSRENDLILVAPATADLMAKMACGIADNLATTTLLAANKPVMIAPTMNSQMWGNTATQANLATLKERGMLVIPPADGDLACGEVGTGRLAEVDDIVGHIETFFLSKNDLPLSGKNITVTAGPTHEAIDPVRYIANHSSGKQGYAIANALKTAGANVTLITGPTNIATPKDITVKNILSARDMMEATESTLPADVVICVAAVADWHVKNQGSQKIKKQNGEMPTIEFTENPDILKTISHHDQRPSLVIGFAAETQNIVGHATAKLAKKGCDWIIANDVSGDVMGGEQNQVHFITDHQSDPWPKMDKTSVAIKLTSKITDFFKDNK